MRKVVFDTNTLVSAALLRHSTPRQAFDAAIATSELLSSSAALEELADVLFRSKFDSYVSQAARLLFYTDYVSAVKLLVPTETITACRDAKDNTFLEISVAGQAEYLITGDQDLLVLHPYRNTQIITPAQFMSVM